MFKTILIVYYCATCVIWATVMRYQILDNNMELKKWFHNITYWNLIWSILCIPATILNIFAYYFAEFFWNLMQKIENYDGFLFRKINKD